MKIRMLAGVACAALMALASPAQAATSPELPSAASYDPAADQAVNAFYAARAAARRFGCELATTTAARELIGVLQRASLDGDAERAGNRRAGAGAPAQAPPAIRAAVATADRLLSTAWVQYVEALQTPPAGMTYADKWVTPRRDSAAAILARAAAAPSLAAYVRSVSSVNPLYAQLRDAAWSAMQSNGGQLDPRVLASLDRARDIPPQGRYVMIDTAGARLYMIEDGNIVDIMKVIVGKSDPSTQTPMIASTIYYATLNPYWHVSAEMVRSTDRPNVSNRASATSNRVATR